MKNYPHPILAKEGWPFIALASIVTILAFIFSILWLAIPLLLITIFIVQFFRDPARDIPAGDNLILAPADGKIICIEECQDPYQAKPSLKISIFMNVFNVHSNRSPLDGDITALNYYPGKFINADFDKASTENERNAMIIKPAHHPAITVVQIAGLIARRILCYVRVHEHLTRGQRYGFIRFGSRVDLYLPTNVKLHVHLSQNVKASSSIIASFND